MRKHCKPCCLTHFHPNFFGFLCLHRHWAVAVKDLLVPGNNQLIISIRPAMQERLQLQEQYPYTVPSLHQFGQMGVYNFMRKPASGGQMYKLTNGSSLFASHIKAFT
eukprot:GHUV01053476.1.p1 GENE.GHUV01053476.1~~GHUV01053476.1.p1  ORF type:complete len:107 (+),score=15.57 GHUV01053476.1:477-797(+)